MLQSSDLRRQRIAADITAQLPAGTFNLSIDQVASILGCHPGHVRNQISDKVFPIDTISLGKRRLVPLTNLIDYLAGLIVGQQQPTVPNLGRPTKALQRAHREHEQRTNQLCVELKASKFPTGLPS